MGRCYNLPEMNKELFEKYLNNSYSEEEFDIISGWIKSQALKKESKRWGFDDWKSFNPEVSVNDKEKYTDWLNQIHKKIILNQNNPSDKGKLTLSNLSVWIGRVAAVLILPLLGILFYVLSVNNFQLNKYSDVVVDSLEIVAPIGSRTVVQLSDGTVAHLNFGSKIKYPHTFNGETREVMLTGEGYFNVAHNPEQPFIVKTKNLNVKAIGTEFNVSAYPDNDFVATTLVKGKVLVEKPLNSGNSIPVEEMKPGQHINYNIKTNKAYSSVGDVEKYVAWKDGKLVFKNEPIVQIANSLGRMFNVDIEVAEEIRNFTFTVTLVDEPLFQILDLMTIATPVDYQVVPRKKQSDGTFTKQKIIIKKRV